ncbi:hypothetical protein DUNSADRAFT_5184 [Dunaliella salina]|uniref:MYND-type domain-containing protein n=1 Tax=Dunaliella salina TaxID=3046 RepID=A0ABQ7GQS7_DUNSA|nr:hypothetical protein DUNSADRAFT_5184 [Dunaliella salina]|eukprot:KAF5836955.1 hypothetical protein DUNSADRAFT_5184 [Dunaliella salina]
MAAGALSRHPGTISELVQFMAKAVTNIQKSRVHAVQACTAAMEFVLRLLGASDGSTAFHRQFPLLELGNSAVLAILGTIELQITELIRNWPPVLCTDSLEGVSRDFDRYSALLRVAVNLLLQMSQLPGSNAVRILSTELAGTPGFAAAALALLECGDVDAHTKAESIMEVIAEGVRAAAVRFASGESISSNSSKQTGTIRSTSESAAAGCRSSVKGSAGRASKPNRVCESCGRAGKLKVCARCGSAWFCDASCQRAAWPKHRLLCAPKAEGAAVP